MLFDSLLNNLITNMLTYNLMKIDIFICNMIVTVVLYMLHCIMFIYI